MKLQMNLWGRQLLQHPIGAVLLFFPIIFISYEVIINIVSFGLHTARLSYNLNIFSYRNLVGISVYCSSVIVAVLVSVHIWIRCLGYHGLGFIGLDKDYGRFFAGVILGIITQFSFFVVLLLLTWLKIDQIHLDTPSIVSVLMSIVASLNAGFTEEVIFRGVLFSSIRSRYNWWLAAFTTSLFFGVLHVSNQLTFPISTVLCISIFGLLFAWVREITGSLWIPIGIHFAWDAATGFFNLGASQLPNIFVTSFNAPTWIIGNGGLKSWILVIIFVTVIGIFSSQQRKRANTACT